MWTTVTAVAVTLGACAALVAWTLSAVLIFFAVMALIGGCMTAALSPEGTPRARCRRALTGAAAVGVGFVALGGLFALLEAAALPLLLGFVLTSPTLLAWLRRRIGKPSAEPRLAVSPESPEDHGSGADTSAVASEAVDEELPLAPDRLDDDALCWAWRKSYIILQRSRTPSARLRVAEVRQLYLDELERRNPSGLSTWLASGARAAGDPSPFVRRPSSQDQHDSQGGQHDTADGHSVEGRDET